MVILSRILEEIFWEGLLRIFYFPIWWYTKGLKKKTFELGRGIKNLSRDLALRIMLTHIFKPMFGELTRSGRIISFFMRLVLLGWRLFLFMIGSLGWLLFWLVWIFLPIIAVWQILAWL